MHRLGAHKFKNTLNQNAARLTKLAHCEAGSESLLRYAEVKNSNEAAGLKTETLQPAAVD